MTQHEGEGKVIDLQSYEFDKTFEKLQNIIESPDVINDLTLKNILNALIAVNKTYYQTLAKVSVALETHTTIFEKTTMEIAKHNDMLSDVAVALDANNESMKRINEMIKDHTEMFNVLADKIGM